MTARFRGIAVSCHRDRRTDPDGRLVTLAVVEPGEWTLTGRRVPQRACAHHPTLIGIDQSSVFDFRARGSVSATSVHITQARLMLPLETVRRGIDNLRPELPLYPLAQQHLQHLAGVGLAAPGLVPELAACTVDVVRSLLIASSGAAETVDAASDLIGRITRHIDTNISDADLGPETIAAAHSISVRQLYKIWPAGHGSLGGYVAARRLHHARASLLTHPHLSIAAIARKHGFAHPTHFAQRFRATYGITPSGWRRHHQDRMRGA